MRWMVAVFLGLTSASAIAQKAPDPRDASAPARGEFAPATVPTRIDPTFAFLKDHLTRYGRTGPLIRLRPDTRIDGAGALIALQGDTARAVAELESMGVVFARSGAYRRVGDIWAAWVPFAALPAIARDPRVRRVEATWTFALVPPLNQTVTAVGASNLQTRPDAPLQGRGILIADVDSGIDPTHPHFFFADAGRYAWLDVDEDGGWTQGVDGVDLDADGRIGPNEILALLNGAAVHDGVAQDNDDAFQPNLDWLYVDANGNRARDAGREAGFTDEDAAFGEPLFVAEDINRNARLDLGEPLWRLGTSKVRAVVDGDAVYERGDSLLETTSAGDFGYVYHGTAVASILLGGQAAHDRRGVAPGAELVSYRVFESSTWAQNFETSRQFDALADAVDRGVDVFLHEWTDPFRAPHDGSTLFEDAMASSRNAGMVHVAAAGNLTLAGKTFWQTSPSADFPLEFSVDGDVGAFFGMVMASTDLGEVTLSAPGGAATPLDVEAVEVATGVFASWVAQITARNNAHAQFAVWSESGALPLGTWTLTVRPPEGTSVFARVSDEGSYWAPGAVTWATPSQNGTVTYPATADAAFVVGALAGRWDLEFDGSRVGDVRNFSGRGPRFDGVNPVDLVAPDDPFAAVPGTAEFVEAGYQLGWLATFGGTSGSAPHVAGSLALMREALPDDSPDQLETRLRESANAEGLDAAAVPDPAFGWGRLDVGAALDWRVPPTNRAPDVSVVVASDGLLAQAVDPDGDAVMYRFDVDHDGTFDTPWTTQGQWSGPRGTSEFARVDVRDAWGATRGALVKWADDTVGGADEDPVVPPPDDCESCDTSSAGVGWLGLLAWLALVRRKFR